MQRLLQRLPRVILDPYLRRRARLHETPLDRFEISVARTAEDHQQAFLLVRTGYVFQGIEDVQFAGMPRITRQHLLPESTIFVAREGEQVVGTMTVTLDSPAGLPLEQEYPDEVAALRADGARIVEYGSLAVVRRCWHAGVTTLLNLAANWFSVKVLEADHCVISIHPKAALLYRALYNFAPFGPLRMHGELRAPAVGLVQEMSQMPRFFERRYQKRMSSGRTVYEHHAEHLPACVKMPPTRDLDELARWKLPRDVFRRLFVEQTDHVSELDPATRAHLEGWRSVRTLGTRDRETIDKTKQLHAVR